MNFPVPWRALLPVDALPNFTLNNGLGLKEICEETGASIEISGEGDTPSTLSDKIATISGAIEQKEAACRRVVDKLRNVQDVADQEPGVFVIIVPTLAAPMVVGQRGSQIKEVIELSGAEISVGKENILGMVDQPIGITGTGGQVVSAVSKINAILQDCADRGKLQPSDFRYRPNMPGAGGMHIEPPGGGRGMVPSGGNPRTHAKFVVATQVAGWIIGKQGRHIRELQENSGSHIQVLKEGEVPPGVSPTDRVVEIGGRYEAKAEGIQIVLMAIDSMPALQAPRETLMLIPKNLAGEAEIRELQQMSGVEVERRDLPGYGEVLCTLLGTIEGRVKAAQQILARLEEDAKQSPGKLATFAPINDVRATELRERHVEPVRPEPLRTEPLRTEPLRTEPLQPEPARVETVRPEQSAPVESPTDPWCRADPWSRSNDARQPVELKAQSTVPLSGEQRDASRSVRTEACPLAQAAQEQYNGTHGGLQPFVNVGAITPPMQNGTHDATRGSQLARETVAHTCAGFVLAPAAAPTSVTKGGHGHDAEDTGGHATVGSVAGSMEGLSFGSVGNEAIFHMALRDYSGRSCSRLFLLMPIDAVHCFLLPKGHLAAIARKCGVQIELGGEVPPNMRHVSLTGTMVANSMASYLLQQCLQRQGLTGKGGVMY